MSVNVEEQGASSTQSSLSEGANGLRESGKSTADPLRGTCDSCGEVRETIIQCLYCGDRHLITEALSPYERLRLVPNPLFSEEEVQAAKEALLLVFHPLRASRLNAKWSLRQRALICRDADTLSSITGALNTYVDYLLTEERIKDKSKEATLDSSEYQGAAQDSPDSYLNTFLLETAQEELSEYDGYQERERLLNRVSRELLCEGRRVGNALLQRPISLAQLRALSQSIKIMGDWERWLSERRHHSLGWRS